MVRVPIETLYYIITGKSLTIKNSPRPPSGSEVWTRRKPPRLQLPHRVSPSLRRSYRNYLGGYDIT
ncbi:hypothetical protein I8752_16740 [Nostocaceae cyanobacterium CENA369]|uniref:Uncharacterized protein n=1 Tax=Dendronalium phyllosphericum CENA369 TaxID=1725256 RepID=A0A8J7I7K7_9NOST|nr:hypothetical protein [Dendronalium phyllosphericum]MBH8574641.1 hypothetical protein [Dendronalium phyllosphericum CENA369]